MNEYEYEVSLRVRVVAFDMNDADDIIQDAFGLGDTCGAEIYESEVTALGTTTS